MEKACQSWSEDNRWILYESVKYLLGKGLHFGGKWGPIFNPKAHTDGVYCIYIQEEENANFPSLVGKGALDAFQNKTFDWITLQDCSDPDILKKTVSKLRNKGHLILINCEYSDQDFKNVRSAGFIQKVKKTNKHNTLQILEAQFGGKKGILFPKGGDPGKKACIMRFGAIGDLIMITPLIKELSKDGYTVSVITQKRSTEVLKENPYITELLPQERDAIPNIELGAYEKYLKPRYDKWINLSESIEGSILKNEGRKDFFLPKDLRDGRNINYWDKTLEAGGYTVDSPRGELFFTKKEEKFGQDMTSNEDTFYVLCALKGSAHHKFYPILAPSINDWIKSKRNVVVYLTGDSSAEGLSWENSQVYSLVNKTTIRDALVLTKHVDLVIGPETGMLNAASCFDTPKIMFMSHSHPDSISKYWTNTTCLTPNVPCYPCYQLHQKAKSCPIQQSKDKAGKVLHKGPACVISNKEDGAIPATVLFKELDKVYGAWLKNR